MGSSLSCVRHTKNIRKQNHDQRDRNLRTYTVIVDSENITTTTTMNGLDAVANGEAMDVSAHGMELEQEGEQSISQVTQTDRHFQIHNIHTVDFAIPHGYKVQEYLGGGSYGNVVKAQIQSRDEQMREVAIKKFHQPFNNVTNARRVYRELRLLQMMRHDNVIRAVDVYSLQKNLADFKEVYVVTEFAGNSIHEIIKRQREDNARILMDEHIRFIIYQVLRALKYIHSANVMHRDLKPSNLALTRSCDLTVLDFGLARTLATPEKQSAPLSTYVMTRWYRSPEVIYWKIDSYDTQADIWSVGCIAAELMTNRPLFPGDSNAQYDMITNLCGTPDEILLKKIEENNTAAMRQVIEKSHTARQRKDFYEYFNGLPVEAIDFLDKILVLDPERRMSVEQALRHQYMSEFHMPEDEPIAEGHFTLDDEADRTIADWKSAIWDEIQKFQGDVHSPVFQ